MTLIPLGFWAASGGSVAAGGFDLLETTTLTSSASSVTFSGLDSYAEDYNHLQIRFVGRTDVTSTNLFVRLNSDTGSNYNSHRLYGNGGGVYSAGTTNNSWMLMGSATGTSQTTNSFGATVIDLLDFSSTSKYTTARSLNGNDSDISLRSGSWMNTAAVTDALITNLTGNWIAGTRFSIYGGT